MIKVGFIINASNAWIGGMNYYKNLLYAISVLADRKIEPVVFMGKKADANLKAMFGQYATVVESSALDNKSLLNILWRGFYKLSGSPLVLEYLFRKYHIDVWSHSAMAGSLASKTIEWIPDFQHVHLPQMFSAEEHLQRNNVFAAFAQKSDVVVLSSYDALHDYAEMFPHLKYKARVLQFVSQPDKRYFDLGDDDKKYLESQYGIQSPYFYLPNQFWKHKNHKVVFEAVNILKQQGIEMTLVCTGHLEDYRNKEHLHELTDYIKSHGLEKNILVLGLVPYKDVFTLIRFSAMVINPSFFEGWSSTVEECKSVGKMMVLSDLNVHKEQFPEAMFFQRENSADLAAVLKEIILGNKAGTQALTYDLAEKTRLFASTYQNIVIECMEGKNA